MLNSGRDSLQDSPFKTRRTKLLEQFGVNDLIILVTARPAARNADNEYPFRADSDFYYLTGFEESDAVAILAPLDDANSFTLFNLPHNAEDELWLGAREGQDGAVKKFGANQSFSIDEFAVILPKFLETRRCVHVQGNIDASHKHMQIILGAINTAGCERKDILPVLANMRSIKDEAELAIIRKAISITGQAHLRAMEKCRPGCFEYQVEAPIVNQFVKHGSRAPAYSNIVASGPNSCTLHYHQNNRVINDGDLVLIDAGCEYQNYASDITRTFPANGVFTNEQRAIYEIVLRAQQAGFDAIKPGVPYKAVRDAVDRVIATGLHELGLLTGSIEDILRDATFTKFYMHSFGHWIGLDVHDVGEYDAGGEKRMRMLEAGMVLTMEPGIYIADTHADVDPKWHNIGVRIEDMALVTPAGCEVLSAAIPKSVAEIEKIMRCAAARRANKQVLFAAHDLDMEKATLNQTAQMTMKNSFGN